MALVYEATDGAVNEPAKHLHDDDEDDAPLVPDPDAVGQRVGFFHPTRWGFKGLVLVLICLTSLGSYFCYDNPAALQKQIKRDMDVTTTQFELLYSLYSWPNVIVCFFGGFLVDRVFGVRFGAILFGGLLLIGHYIFAVGAFVNRYWVMEAGRFIFGLGGENLQVAVNAYAVNWFKGNQLNLVMGLGLSVSRAGSAMNMNLMGPLYNSLKDHGYTGHICLGLALFIGGATLVFSQYCTLQLAWMDKYAKKIVKPETQIAAGEKISMWDVKDFPLSLWLISLICVAYYTAIFPFVNIGVIFFESKYLESSANAQLLNSLIFTISAVASPLLGFSIDYLGRNLFWTALAIILTMVGHALMAFTFVTPYLPICIMGFAYSMLASSLWPMVALVIKEHQLGTAYGVMQAVQNLGLAVLSIVVGVIVDNEGYLILEVFFLALLCAALLACIALFVYDAKVDGLLCLSAKDQQARFQRDKLALEEKKEKIVVECSDPCYAS